MAKLPYFRWYPKDAATDRSYLSMTMAERGLYHTLLNTSWMNDGLPTDLNDLALEVGLSRKMFDVLWAKVSRCWTEKEGKFYNARQEEERNHANAISQRNKRVGNANAFKGRSAREYLDEQRAYGSGSVSDSEKQEQTTLRITSEKPIHATDLNGSTSMRFLEWFAMWSRVRGTFNRTKACQAYVSVVTTENETACFECTASYLAGLENPSRGFNPDNFLFQQARDNFEARWPPRKKTLTELLDEEEANAS